MKSNYHTHHELCGHAEGTAWDYVEEAIKHKFQVIGITDHAPSKDIHDYGVRMHWDDFSKYLEDIERAKRRAGQKIEVVSGLEVEYFPNNEEYYEMLKQKVDYLIHGQHYISTHKRYSNLRSGFGLHTKEDLHTYASFLVDAIESDHFLIMAHPDLYMCGYREWDETAIEVAHKICEAAQKHQMILEYNANGYRRRKVQTTDGLKRPYPRTEFWEIVKQYDIKTVINSDCHSPSFLYDDTIKEAEEDYQKLNLNHIDFIDITSYKKR